MQSMHALTRVSACALWRVVLVTARLRIVSMVCLMQRGHARPPSGPSITAFLLSKVVARYRLHGRVHPCSPCMRLRVCQLARCGALCWSRLACASSRWHATAVSAPQHYITTHCFYQPARAPQASAQAGWPGARRPKNNGCYAKLLAMGGQQGSKPSPTVASRLPRSWLATLLHGSPTSFYSQCAACFSAWAHLRHIEPASLCCSPPHARPSARPHFV
jgi:hypothetical protein